MQNLISLVAISFLLIGCSHSESRDIAYSSRRFGVDGSTLSVTGYVSPHKAENGRNKSIYRWAAERSAIGKTFKDLLDLAGADIKCFHYD